MMKITRDNYEIFFIDFIEGNLNDNDKAELFEFLKHNNDLAAELSEFDLVKISAELKEFENKASLQKSINDVNEINENNFDEFSIAYYEGDLNETQQQSFLTYLNENEYKKKDHLLIQKTFLQPEIVKYPHKNKLKIQTTRQKVVRLITIYGSVAAVMVLGFIIISRFNSDSQINQVAENKDTSNEKNIVVEDITNETSQSITAKNVQITSTQNQIKKTTKKNSEVEETQSDPINRESIQLKSIQPIGEVTLKNQWNKSLTYNVNNYEFEMPKVEKNNNLLASDLSMEKIEEFFKDEISNPRITLKDIADLGLKSFNRLTESNYNIKAEKSENGSIKAIQFSNGEYIVIAPISK